MSSRGKRLLGLRKEIKYTYEQMGIAQLEADISAICLEDKRAQLQWLLRRDDMKRKADELIAEYISIGREMGWNNKLDTE